MKRQLPTMGINNESDDLNNSITATASTTSKLNLNIFREIFEKDDIVITSFEEAHGSGRGDNYTATLFRILLKGYKTTTTTTGDADESNTDVDGINSSTTTKNDNEKLSNLSGKKLKWEKSVICKRLPDSRARREAYKSEQLFRNEVEFYTKIIPELIAFQQTKSKDVLFKAIPKCYLARNDLIILEDLRVRKFIMPNRQKGLNFDELSAVLTELAKFHSMSLAYKAQHPNQFNTLKNHINEGMFKLSNTEWYHNYYKRLAKNAFDMVTETLNNNNNNANTNALNSNYLKHLKDFLIIDGDGDETKIINNIELNPSTSFFQRMVELISEESQLSVICHGDCWTNNFLYRYSTNTNTNGGIDMTTTTTAKNQKSILETCIVDFQLIRYGSLALDLANVIFCCTDHDLRKENMNNFLKVYYNELVKSLKIYGGPMDGIFANDAELWKMYKEIFVFQYYPTFFGLKMEFHRYGKFGLGLALDILPISTCSSEDAPDLYMDHLLTDEHKNEAPQLDVPPNDLCRRKMTDIVIDLVTYGML